MQTNLNGLKQELVTRQKALLASGRKSIPEGIDSRKGDDIDLAESAYEQEMAYIMKSRGVRELQVINEALDKIQGGEYGICEECGDLIGEKRLEAMPFVKYCVECQARHEERSQLEAIGVEMGED